MLNPERPTTFDQHLISNIERACMMSIWMSCRAAFYCLKLFLNVFSTLSLINVPCLWQQIIPTQYCPLFLLWLEYEGLNGFITPECSTMSHGYHENYLATTGLKLRFDDLMIGVFRLKILVFPPVEKIMPKIGFM